MSKFIKRCLPPKGASSTEFRISGVIFLLGAIILGIGSFVLVISIGQKQLAPSIMLIPLIIWMMGTHRLLWGGVVTENQLVNAGRVAATAVVGYVSLVVTGGLIGAIAGLIKGSV